MLALCRKAPNSLIQLLLQSGADPHLSDGGGRTVLYFAVRELNLWAIKWLVAENVDLEVPVGGPGDSKPVFQHLFDYCDRELTSGSTNFNRVLNYLRAMQVLALAGTNNVGNSFAIKQTKAQLFEGLSSFIPKSDELLNAHSSHTHEIAGKDLREIRDIVHALTGMMSNPLSLLHLCRVQIRRSLGRDFRRKLHQLNVPLPLQEYLVLYKESDILL